MSTNVICNDELKYMLNLARYLSLNFDEQYNEMELFARWNLSEEIGLEWIDAKSIILSENLSHVLPTETIELLISILNNFENAFDNSEKNDVWNNEAMRSHSFWQEQRKLAKQFLSSVRLYENAEYI